MIVCYTCSKEKEDTEYHVDKTRKTGRKGSCKECLNSYNKSNYSLEKGRAKNKRWRELNKNKTKMFYRKWALKRQYGITLEEYDDMLKKQQGLCYLCGLPETASKATKDGVKNLAVDHCHKTGKVRKLLCTKCNTAIGLLNDDIGLVKRLAQYLEE